ncbi:MAG: tRNA (adenosine(37)-N6)-threonylcarbamoyltransferase complex dimerization subunit type 1 TsaB [Dehalococcoidia bacterium]|nr:tRNA (adenosine(37)-N6)-threonylcarbamoyltransferase complex dimerization subunit type 1 TsaB [Dehalococcoidia bacterium]
MIDELLAGDRAVLAGVAVVIGPGSYAGLRVGIATAQGLALASGLPLRGLPTLEAVAAAKGPGDYTAIHPAGRSEYAALAYRDGRPTGPLRVVKGAELVGERTVGEGAEALGGCEVTPGERCRAALLALLPAFAAPGSDELEPLYLREPPVTLPRRARPA